MSPDLLHYSDLDMRLILTGRRLEDLTFDELAFTTMMTMTTGIDELAFTTMMTMTTGIHVSNSTHTVVPISNLTASTKRVSPTVSDITTTNIGITWHLARLDVFMVSILMVNFLTANI